MGIVVVSLLITHNAIVTFYNRSALNDRTEFEEQYLLINEVLDKNTTMINLMDLGLRGYFMIGKENFAQPYDIAMEQYAANLDTLKILLGEVDYPYVDSIDFVKNEISNYADLVGQGITAIENGNPDKAVALFESDPGFTLWNTYSPIINNVSGYLNDLNEESDASYEAIAIYSQVSQIITLLFGVPVLVIVLIRLIRQEKRIFRLFDTIEESNERYIFKDSKQKVKSKTLLDRGVIIERITRNLEKATEFIQQIAQGNLSIEWEGMSEELQKENKETLAGNLLAMRNQLKQVKEEDRKRQWTAEGLANFSDLVRKHHEDFEELTKHVVSYVVKYTESNQGGLYLLNEENEDDPYLELISAYAYNKRKIVEKRIEIGEGLLGQAYLEGSRSVFKEIPEDYINITSGLGQALPRNLVIVPIKLEDNVQGILELAAFEPYEEEHLNFLDRISSILASEIISSKSGALTKKLLDQSKENEEMLRSQEEEMRQNMEELQATQEEQRRQRDELEKRIQELEQQLNSA